jgi:hypothetical protein
LTNNYTASRFFCLKIEQLRAGVTKDFIAILIPKIKKSRLKRLSSIKTSAFASKIIGQLNGRNRMLVD